MDANDVNRKELKKNDVESETPEVTTEVECPILYKILEPPSIGLTIFCAVQQSLISIAGSIILPFIVAQAVCAADDDKFVRKLLSSTLFLSGFTTLLQVTIGIRLPLYQGPSASYIVPIIALNELFPTRCDIDQDLLNSTDVTEAELKTELIDLRIREMMGPLILVGFVHFLIGATGLVGVLLRFIGPVTIVPTILLIGIYAVNATLPYVEVHWGIALMTWIIGLILSLYLRHRPMVLPAWSRKKGWHTFRYPVHQIFAILISILIGWAVCGIMTAAGYFPDDKKDSMYRARTDAQQDSFENSEWIYMPYPGQFGTPLFSINAAVGFSIATLTSILDSIGDYYATAAVCRVPPPPAHGVNRGIAVEGFCSLISGFFGVGHATTTYGGNIGAIGLTRVASRRVFVVVAIIYIILGVIAKISVIFIGIPYPVLGGCLMSILGVFVGVNLSNLKVIDLSSSRNLSIMGTAIFVGLLVPRWMNDNPDTIDTGVYEVNQVIIMLLANPNFIGAFVAFVLDNTVPGTDVERGITAWSKPEEYNDSTTTFIEGEEVYDPPVPQCLKRREWLRYFPLFPKYNKERNETASNGVKNESFVDNNDVAITAM